VQPDDRAERSCALAAGERLAVVAVGFHVSKSASTKENQMIELNTNECVAIEGGGGWGDFGLNMLANAAYDVIKQVVSEYVNSTGSAPSIESQWNSVGYEGAH
jgi:hypothetical protein